jgi:hypothetical protein
MAGTDSKKIVLGTAVVEMEGEDIFRFDLVEYMPLSIMRFAVLDRMNVLEFAPQGPGVFALAHADAHDAQLVEQPYFFGKAGDLQAELLKQLDPQDPALAAEARRGELFFRIVKAEPARLDEALEALKAEYAARSAAAAH